MIQANSSAYPPVSLSIERTPMGEPLGWAISASWVSRCVSTPTTASTISANIGIGRWSFPGQRSRSAPAWRGSPSGISVRSHAECGQASDQASWWARPAPATTTDGSAERHAQAAGCHTSHVAITDAEPGGPPLRSTAATLTDAVERVPGPAAVPEGLLLHAAPDLVDRVEAEPHDVKGVHHA